jgi:uncharacterized lipoprotein
MWRRLAITIGVILAGLLAGCSLGANEGASSTPASTGWTAYPVHKLRVPYGTTRSVPSAALTYPLTVICPKPAGATTRSGFHQVIRTPIKHGASYGDSTNGTSIMITVPQGGRIDFQCS